MVTMDSICSELTPGSLVYAETESSNRLDKVSEAPIITESSKLATSVSESSFTLDKTVAEVAGLPILPISL